ncbi:MAG: hypothetical protein KBA66_07645 [Leptospiraceae bacterium]|nr:hypothetical protein [Leptospiraceae bacterium]
MIVEAITFSINLSIFSCLFWSIVTFQNIRLIEKIKKFPLFIFFSILFYATFYLSSFSHTKFFEFKSIYFSWYTILIQIVFLISVLVFSKKPFLIHAPLLSVVLSPYFFFLVFGFETFHLWEDDFPSYSLLKAQNPIIGTVGLFLLFIKPNKIQIPAFLLTIGILFYYLYPLKNFPYPEIRTLHHRYIPHEFFLTENSYLFEENSGIYTEKKQNEDDVLYKLTWKPIKKINLPLRQTIQSIASNFEFPLLITEDNKIILLELSRSYNGNFFKVVFNLEQESKEIEVIGNSSSINQANIQLEGPLF